MTLLKNIFNMTTCTITFLYLALLINPAKWAEKPSFIETVIDKVTLYAGGKALDVPAFEVEWLDASRVAVTFKLFKVTSNPQTDIVVTATHTWNLRRRAFARHMVNNATSESRSLREHSGRRMSIARRAVDNETAETSEHSVVVYIAGGASYEEATKVAELNASGGIQVVLGGSYVHNSGTFLEDLDDAFGRGGV